MFNRSLGLPFAFLILLSAGCPAPAPGGNGGAPASVTLDGATLTTDEDTPLRVELAPVVTGDPGAVELAVEASPAHGKVTLAGGVFTYTPAADFNGADGFQARARAGDAESEPARVKITVRPVNDAPQAVDDAYALLEDETFTPPLGVLVNDEDVDGDALAASVVAPPAHGTLALDAGGGFTYQPDADYFGADSFTYRAADGADASEATVTLDVAPVNDAPAITSATIGGVYQAGVTAFVTAAGWSDADFDPPAYLYRWMVDGVTVPVAGAVLPATYVTRAATLAAFVTPFDGKLAGLEVAAAPVTVPNLVPTAIDASYSVTAPLPLEATLGYVDDGGPITFEIVTPPQHGALTLGYASAFTYSPLLGYAGADAFAYRVSDGTSFSNTAVVSLTLAPVPLSPEAPYRNDVIQGALPAAACGLDRAFGIVSMTPATDTALQPNTSYDFTAVVSYAVKTTETIWLVAINDAWVFHQPQPAEKVTLQPSNGCAQTTVSLQGVTTGTSRSLELMLDGSNGGGNKITGQAVTYFIAGAPSLRIVGTNPSLDQPLTLGPDSTTTVTFQLAWNNVPNDWIGPFQTYSPSLGNYYGGWYPLSGSAGTATIDVTVGPGKCSDDFTVVGFGITNTDWSLGSWEQVRVLFAPPNLIVHGETSYVQQVAAAPQARSLNVQNCTSAPLGVTVASSTAWVHTQASPVTIAAGAAQSVTFSTDAQSLAAARYAGAVTLAPWGLAAVNLPVTLLAGQGTYVAVPTTYAWMSEAVTASTLVSRLLEDEVNHPFALPFAFTYYGVTADTIYVNTNGYVTFNVESDSDYTSGALPVARLPLSLMVDWNDLNPDAGQGIYVATVGTAPNRAFVVTWQQLGEWGNPLTTRTGQLVLYEGSDAFLVQYETVQAADIYGTNLGDGAEAATWAPTAGSAFLVSPN